MSYFDTICDSVKTVIAALPNFSGVTCAHRKRLFVSTDHGDTLPFCVVAPGRESIALLYFGNGAHVDYTVNVAIVQAKGATLADATQRQWQQDRREEIRKALYKSGLSGASTVMACVKYEPEPVFDLQGLDQLFDVSVQAFTFRSNETRSS